MSRVIIYVEGGGDTRGLQAPLREGFHKLFRRVLGDAAQPKVVACGGRQQAFDDFVQGVKSNPQARCILLVDSEEALADKGSKWAHVKRRRGDGWTRPPGVDEGQLQMMVQVMESWLVADPEVLASYFGQGFYARALPRTQNLEGVAKLEIYQALAKATARANKGSYRKAHGFELIGMIDPRRIEERCVHARAFFAVLAGADGSAR